jgi:hypothetical protein
MHCHPLQGLSSYGGRKKLEASGTRCQKARCAPIEPQIYYGGELSNYYKHLLSAER